MKRLWAPVLVGSAFLAFFILGISPSKGQAQGGATVYGTDTQWPGIRFEIVNLQRTMQNRLAILVRIRARGGLPPQGIFLGTQPSIPPHATAIDLASGMYRPIPFSVRSTVMIDELSQQQYPSLPPIAPPGKAWLPALTSTNFHSFQSVYLNLQFAIPPPPPPPPDGSKPPQQTLCFLFPKALGPIQHIPLPPSSEK